jgi:hypothetical protein
VGGGVLTVAAQPPRNVMSRIRAAAARVVVFFIFCLLWWAIWFFVFFVLLIIDAGKAEKSLQALFNKSLNGQKAVSSWQKKQNLRIGGHDTKYIFLVAKLPYQRFISQADISFFPNPLLFLLLQPVAATILSLSGQAH